MAAPQRKIVHEKCVVKVFEGEKEIGVDEMKKILGWRSEKDPNEKELFGNDYFLKDMNGDKVRLDNVRTNRPFRRGLALRYANEMLRKKWRLNPDIMGIDDVGDLQQGQHRGIGLILGEQIRKKSPEIWKEYGTKGPLTMPIGIMFGFSHEADTVDTIDLGQKRSLGDVLYRNQSFEKADKNDQKFLTNILAASARLVWMRLGGMMVVSAPKFEHSVALDLIDDHPRILDCVDFIVVNDNGTEKQIRGYLSLGAAAGLMYLMATCKSKAEKFDESGEIDDSMYSKAEKFWNLFSTGAGLEKGSPILVLKTFLKNQSASGAEGRDAIIAAVVLAWNCWLEDKKMDGVKDLKPGSTKNEKTGKSEIDMPYMGGLDVKRVAPPKPEVVEEVKDEKPKAGKKGKKPAAPPAPKGKGPKAPPAAAPAKGPKGPGKKNISYQFKEGDQVFCKPDGKDENNVPYSMYEARVAKIENDGRVTVCPLSEPTLECELDPTKADYVGLEKPAA